MTITTTTDLFRGAGLVAVVLALSACAGTGAGTGTTTDTSYTTMPASAANSMGLDEATVIPGTCARLVAAGEDITALCAGKTLLSTAPNGRVQIMVTMARGSSLMFSGPDLPNPDANTDAFAVDRFYLASPALPGGPKISPANGYCTYSNPYIAPARIACSADVDGLPYEFAFMASGLLRQ